MKINKLKVFLLVSLIVSSLYSSSFSTIKDDIRSSGVIVIGEVLESDGKSHLIKLNHWNKNINNSNYIKLKAQKKLNKFSNYLFLISKSETGMLEISNPQKEIFEIKNMGEYKFFVRDYQSDKPMIGQIGIKDIISFMKKELNVNLRSRSLSRYEKSSYGKYSNTREIASYEKEKLNKSKLSINGLIIILLALFGISIFVRKSKL